MSAQLTSELPSGQGEVKQLGNTWLSTASTSLDSMAVPKASRRRRINNTLWLLVM